MSDLTRAITLVDDVTPVFEALSQLCREQRIQPDSVEGARLACILFDLLQTGASTTTELVIRSRTRTSSDIQLEKPAANT